MTKLIDITGKAKSGEWGTDDDIGNGIPVLRTTNFTYTGKINFNDVITRIIKKKNIEDKYLRKGDIIIEKSGGSDKFPVGRVIYFDGEENKYLFNNFTGLLRIQDKEKWYPKYVLYSLLANYNRGGTRRFENKTTGLHNLKIDDYVKKFDVKDIEYANQVNISIQLDKLDKIICKYNEEIKMLDDLIKARFVEMFGNPKLNPMGWEQVTLEEACTSIVRGPFGSALKKEFFVEPSESTYKVYEQKHAIQKSATIGAYYITEQKFKELKRFECFAGDILMSCSGTMGELYQLPKGCERGIINQALCKFTLNNEILPIYFLNYMKQIIGNLETKGSGIKNIAAVSYVKQMSINLPPIELQNKFADFVRQVDKSKFMNKKVICKFLMEGVKIK